MIELKIPEVGESVQEALLAQWLKKDGESVRKDEVLFVIETDKVTLEIAAPADGVLKITVAEGRTVKVGATATCTFPAASPRPAASSFTRATASATVLCIFQLPQTNLVRATFTPRKP